MADCTETMRELELFLDGELSPEECAHVASHLEECLECFHAFDFQAELKAVIAAKGCNDAMPPGLLDRIRQCLDDPAEPSDL
jgi:mycothiol system anti-sigma-R factor